MPPAKSKNRPSPNKYSPAFGRITTFALALPGVEARSSYGTPGLYVGKKFMARLRDDDRDVMVLKPVEDDEQRFLLETQPDVFFKTPHYVGWPGILIRLSKIAPPQLQELVEQSWRRLASKRMLAEHEQTSVGADPRVRPTRRTRTEPR